MWNITVDKTWTADQKKKLQQMLNQYGFTDDNGELLAVDGEIGPKTQQALVKMNTYQQHLANPDPETRALQAHLSGMGFKNADGTPLKVDGIYGPKTDAAYNDFENNFLDGITGGKNTQKTVQTKTYPAMPKASDRQIQNAITSSGSSPTGYDVWGQRHAYTGKIDLQQTQDEQYKTDYGTGAVNANYSSASKTVNQAQPAVKPVTDPEAGQKNPDGTWKQVAIPGAWAGSGETSLETIASMSKLYQPYAQANKDAKNMQDLANSYKQQADSCTQKAVEAAEKVRMGLAQPEDEYNSLQQKREYLQNQADAAQKQADDLRKKSDDLKQHMDSLAAKQTRGMLQESELFNSPEAAAADFAKRAMPLTDNTSHEYSAVMTEVRVPEYKDGKMQMVPKYKYGAIKAGKIDNVVDNALTGLLTPSEGKKYLLHTHPNSTDYESDNFSGLPNPAEKIVHDSNDGYNWDKIEPLGDASIPTLAGTKWYSLLNILTNVARMNTGVDFIKGYDGIYLAAPSGNLYYYTGLGSDKYQGNSYKDLRNQNKFKVPENLTKSKGKWDSGTQTYRPGCWENGQFIEY